MKKILIITLIIAELFVVGFTLNGAGNNQEKNVLVGGVVTHKVIFQKNNDLMYHIIISDYKGENPEITREVEVDKETFKSLEVGDLYNIKEI